MEEAKAGGTEGLMHGIVGVLRRWQTLRTEDFGEHHVYHTVCLTDGVWFLESPMPISKWRCPVCGETLYPIEWKPVTCQKRSDPQ